MLSTFGGGMFHTDVFFQLFISPGALTSYSVIYDIYAIRRVLHLTLAMTFIGFQASFRELGSLISSTISIKLFNIYRVITLAIIFKFTLYTCVFFVLSFISFWCKGVKE